MTTPPDNPGRPVRVGAIVVAAGAGRRMGPGANKILRLLGGRSVLERSVQALAADPRVTELIVVVRPCEQAALQSQLQQLELGPCQLRLTPGGEQRFESVRNGVAAASEDLDILLVHDAARPFASRRLISEVIDQAARRGAASPALAVVDTLKRVRDGQVVETLDRTGLYGAQTPQGFRARVLRSALKRAGQAEAHTDEALLLEQLGVPVAVVPGDPLNIKITTSGDLELAASLLQQVDPDRAASGEAP